VRPEGPVRERIRELGRRALLQYVVNAEAYGIMNYYFSLPISVKKGRFRFAASYNYNIPVALPGETFTLDNSWYTAFNLYYSIPFRHYLK